MQWQSARTWFLHLSPYCVWLSHFIANHPPPSQESKLWQPIWYAWCYHVAFYHGYTCLCYSIGRDKQTNSQHKLHPNTQACVFHFWSFCLWLAATDPCTSLWMAHPQFMCMHVCKVTLWLIRIDSQMLSTNFSIEQSVYFSGNSGRVSDLI